MKFSHEFFSIFLSFLKDKMIFKSWEDLSLTRESRVRVFTPKWEKGTFPVKILCRNSRGTRSLQTAKCCHSNSVSQCHCAIIWKSYSISRKYDYWALFSWIVFIINILLWKIVSNDNGKCIPYITACDGTYPRKIFW